VKLWKASTQAQLIRNESSGRKRRNLIQDFVESDDEWLDAVILWFDDEPRISTNWFTSRVTKYFGIHAEEWVELTKTSPIVPLLASESSDNAESDWSVDDAFIVLSSLNGRELGSIVESLSEPEAYLFWQVALGEAPPLSKRDFLRAIAQFTDYTTEELRQCAAHTPFLEIVEKAVAGTLCIDTEITAHCPLKPPARYLRWGKLSLPYDKTIVDVVNSPRHFLHYTGSDGIIYSRSGELLQSWESTRPEGIFEIECSEDCDPSTVILCDVLLDGETHFHNEPYTHRQSHLKETYPERSRNRVYQIETTSEYREILRALKSQQRIRLLYDGPYYDSQFIGGYVAQQQMLNMPLLITHVRKMNGIHIRFSAMDGYTPVYLGQSVCPDDVANALRNHPHFGPRMDDVWTPMDDIGCIIWVSAVSIKSSNGNYHLENPMLLHVDTTMGHSDVIQLADILVLMPE